MDSEPDKLEESHRPWGYYEIIAEMDDHKVKGITVYPGGRMSLQRHRRRAEHWFIVRGRALVTLNGRDQELSVGDSVDIPLGAQHRIKNIGNEDLYYIEVQIGDYFGEDDVERLEDDYGRV
jgi:mannose-6-phosphate isomerase-like protein (cupin superfamily)